MSTQRRMQLWAAAPAGALILLAPLLSACGSAVNHPTHPTTRPPYGNLYYEVAMTQCLIDKDIIPRRVVQNQSWFKDDKVLPTGDFGSWQVNHDIDVYGGKKLYLWMEEAHAKWPESFCGPSPAPVAP